jgi:hypothetical protein
VSESSLPEKPPPGGLAPVGNNFKLVFLSVMVLTILFAIGAIWVSVANKGDKPDEGLKNLAEKLFSLTTLGFGAMVGLLGGKSTQ